MADITADWPREAVRLLDQMNLLLAMVSSDARINLSVLIAYGEVYHDDVRVWSDQLIIRQNYTGRVRFTPWRTYRPNSFTAETALHAVVVIVRSVYERVFPDHPTLWATDADAETKQALTVAYVDKHSHEIAPRLRTACEDLDRDEVFNLLTSANAELKQLLSASAPVITGKEAKQPESRQYTPDKIPKGLIRHELKLINDEAFQKLIDNDPMLIHPDHGKRDREVRFDQDALINTEIYNPSMRAAAIAAWKLKAKKP